MARPESARLDCADEPPAPGASGAPVTDDENGAYLTSLRGAWQDCHSAVQWLKDWFSKMPD
jgi:hypothetical protein